MSDITPSREGIDAWSAAEVAYLLESGFRPDFDSVDGAMASVTRNHERVADADRRAVGSYLEALQPASNEGSLADAPPAGGFGRVDRARRKRFVTVPAWRGARNLKFSTGGGR